MAVSTTFDFVESPLFPATIAVDVGFTNVYLVLLFVMPSLSFIMKDYSGDAYQLVFTGTSGSSSGKMYFTKELFSTASIEENSPVLNVGVFPNPTNSILKINFELADASIPAKINLFDVNGRQVKTITNNFLNSRFNQITTDISNLNNGVYLLQITAGSKSITKRIVKQ